jgi:hypothetical protein
MDEVSPLEALNEDCFKIICHYLTDGMFAFCPGYDAGYPSRFMDGIVEEARKWPRGEDRYWVWASPRVFHRHTPVIPSSYFDNNRREAQLTLQHSLRHLFMLRATCHGLVDRLPWRAVFDALAGDVQRTNLRLGLGWSGDHLLPSYTAFPDDDFLPAAYFRTYLLMWLVQQGDSRCITSVCDETLKKELYAMIGPAQLRVWAAEPRRSARKQARLKDDADGGRDTKRVRRE